MADKFSKPKTMQKKTSWDCPLSWKVIKNVTTKSCVKMSTFCLKAGCSSHTCPKSGCHRKCFETFCEKTSTVCLSQVCPKIMWKNVHIKLHSRQDITNVAKIMWQNIHILLSRHWTSQVCPKISWKVSTCFIKVWTWCHRAFRRGWTSCHLRQNAHLEAGVDKKYLNGSYRCKNVTGGGLVTADRSYMVHSVQRTVCSVHFVLWDKWIHRVHRVLALSAFDILFNKYYPAG